MSRFRELDARWRWGLFVLLGAFLIAAVNVWWIVENRHGYPLNVDEYGYTAIGLADWLGFKNGGLHGWWEAIQQQTPNAPLMTTLTSVVLIFSPGLMQGFGVLIAIAVVQVMLSYGLGTRLAGPRLGALAALAVATSEGLLLFAREYVFALPAATSTTAAVYCLVCSDGMRMRWWSAGVGASVGLMLLSRTMAVAFVPGVAVAALIVLLARGKGSYVIRFVNYGIAIVVGFLVAATWYWRNLTPVYEYLTEFGYGEQAQYYGAQHSAVSWARFKTVAEIVVRSDLLAPLALLVLLGLAVLGVVAVRRMISSDDRKATVLHIAGSNGFIVIVVFCAGFAALMSSQNAGDGFTFPLSMLLPPLAVVALRYVPRAAIPVTVMVALIGTANLLSTANLSESLSKQRLVEFPPLGEVPWVNGEPHAVAAIRYQVPGPKDQFTKAELGWQVLDEELADVFTEPIGPEHSVPALVAFASRNRVISTNSVGAIALLDHRVGIPFTQLSATPNDTVHNYIKQLSDPEFGQPPVVVTMSSEAKDFPPVLTQRKVVQAAKRLGFHKLREFTAPDGRRVYVWVRTEPLTSD
jgi:4-amino-4-deoxy-L-arabinose transferase-like glycosyltransferase